MLSLALFVLGTGAALCLASPIATPPPYAPPGHPASLTHKRDALEDGEDGVLTLFLKRGANSPSLAKRWTGVRQLGLGDYADASYFISLDVGPTTLSLQFDTDSSDLLVFTSECTSEVCQSGRNAGVTYYDPSSDTTFEPTGPNFTRYYGTITRTYTTGILGYTDVSLAGFATKHVAFQAVGSANVSESPIGAGLVGAAFPCNSWNILLRFNESLTSNSTLAHASPEDQANAFLAALDADADPINRLAYRGGLKDPSFTLTLQRILDPATSNAGLVTFGGLPRGIDQKRLVYEKVHLYPAAAILPFSFAEALGDVPVSWEVPIEGVSVGGKLLPPSTVGVDIVNDVGNIAVFDSGTGGVLGPSDLVAQIYNEVGYDNTTGTIPCDTKLEFSVHIGGKTFPIDPLDWHSFTGAPKRQNSSGCHFTLFPGDPPSSSFSASWLFGDTFLKNVLLHHDFGSSKDPHSYPPKLGFLSTTDAKEASARFDELVPLLRNGNAPVSSLAERPPVTTTTVANPISTALKPS